MTRKPLRKFLPLTYLPKIAAVQEGKCTQSIRIDTNLTIGDFIAFHGWEGRPYHSPWSFRTPYYRIRLAKPINVHADYVYLPEEKKKLLVDNPLLDMLAAKDYIDPPTGEELLRVLHAMHGPGILRGKVLRWEPITDQLEQIMQASQKVIEDPVKAVASACANVAISSMMPFDFEAKAESSPPVKVLPLTPDPMLDQVVNHFLKVRRLTEYGKERQRRDIPAVSQ